MWKIFIGILISKLGKIVKNKNQESRIREKRVHRLEYSNTMLAVFKMIHVHLTFPLHPNYEGYSPRIF